MQLKNLSDYQEEVEKAIGYKFKNNVALLYQAFTRKSYSVENGGENNEVLEFIGDKVLDYYVVKVLVKRFGVFKSETNFFNPNEDADEFCIKAHKNEADFTQIKQEIISNEHLAEIVDALRLARYMYLGKCDLDNKIYNVTKVKADLLEAIIGAVALDCNWNDEILEEFICDLVEIDEFLDDVDDGSEEYPDKCKEETAINSLKELFEHGYISEPLYDIPEEMVEYKGEMMWSATCYIRSRNIRVTAVANTKKAAKRYAAYLALSEFYGIVPVK